MKTYTLSNKDNIQEFLDNLSNEPTTIFLTKGTYRQNIIIRRDNINLIGESRNETIIVSNKHAKQVNKDLQVNVTFRTETLRITGSNIKLNNLTIQNDSGLGPGVGQGVALSLYGDNIIVNDCNILGTHDTIFLGPLPLDLIDRYTKQEILTFDFKHYDSPKHYFYNSHIEGTVDFIFGSSTAIFNKCTIHALKKGYILAPSTYHNNDIGIVLYDCDITNKTNDKVYLARPWREHGYTAIVNSRISGPIEDNRYHDWSKNNMRLYELPYVQSSLGKELPNKDLITIESIIKSFSNEV